jgi:hypothetical protein
MSDMTEQELRAQAAVVAELDAFGAAVAGRDELIQRAHQVRIPKSEIARRMKISRDTVVRVLGTDEED